jgi:hypothetical protein
MPFLMEADVAARLICDGMLRGDREIAFPRRLAMPMKAMRLLPRWLYDPVIRRLLRQRRKG